MHQMGAVEDTVKFFQNAFTIVVALAIGEVFKQFVADRAENLESERGIHWNRFPALLAFIALVLPFFQGMSRYFYINYEGTAPGSGYAGKLFFDAIVFFIESALFFVMSRALSIRHWRRYYASVLVLMSIDTTWAVASVLVASRVEGLPAIFFRGQTVGVWIELDVVLAAVVGILLLIYWRVKRPWVGAWLGVVLIFGRTFLDYWINWKFYFA